MMVHNHHESLKEEKIPNWLLDNNCYLQNKQSVKTGFLAKTLKELSSVIQNEVYSEQFVAYKGYLQVVDTRVKLLALLFYMFLGAVTNHIFTLILLIFIAAGFVKLSRLSMKHYIKRAWLILPLFIFIMSIPAATNLFVKGDACFYIYKSLHINIGFIKMPEDLYFTVIGIQMIVRMALRIGVSISFAYLLIMTTSWSSITKALSIFRVPSIIITILNMTYRYIFILTKIAVEMMEARLLRTVGNLKNKSNRAFVANGISFLFVRASYMSDEIYDAMRCRCFHGDTVSLQRFKMKKTDYLWIINNVIILMILLMGELIH